MKTGAIWATIGAIIFLWMSGSAEADQKNTHIIASVASHHFGDGEHNEANLGLGIQYKRVGAIRFRNSHDVMSNMIFTDIPMGPYKKYVGLLLGVADGYEAINDNGYLPIIGITVHYKALRGLINTEAVVVGFKVGL